MPSEATIRQVLGRVDGDSLDRVLGRHLASATPAESGPIAVALDGKTVRGARVRQGPAPHLVAAVTHVGGMVLGQFRTADKSNEIPTVRMLLRGLDLVGAVVWSDPVERGHDREEVGSYKVVTVTRGLRFPYAQQAIEIPGQRRRIGADRWSTEVPYAICSLPCEQAPPRLLASWIRGHWSIENGVHWVRDVTFDEDCSTVRAGHGPR